MPHGTVKFFNIARGFGFITASNGEEIYFNTAGLPRERRYDPIEGDAVTFEVREAKQGKVAHRIEMNP